MQDYCGDSAWICLEAWTPPTFVEGLLWLWV